MQWFLKYMLMNFAVLKLENKTRARALNKQLILTRFHFLFLHSKNVEDVILFLRGLLNLWPSHNSQLWWAKLWIFLGNIITHILIGLFIILLYFSFVKQLSSKSINFLWGGSTWNVLEADYILNVNKSVCIVREWLATMLCSRLYFTGIIIIVSVHSVLYLSRFYTWLFSTCRTSQHTVAIFATVD